MKSKAGRNGAMRVLVLGLGLFFMLCARAARTDPLPLGDGDWTIQAVAVGGGSISPAGVIGVADGGSQTFVMLPDTGCKIADALVNGVSVGAVTDWTFTGVAGDQTIEVVFAAYSGVTLKEHGEAGDWIPCETEDTYVSQQSSKERGTNFGAQEIVKCYDAGNGRVGAFRFDLDALPPVGEVLSASLRVVSRSRCCESVGRCQVRHANGRGMGGRFRR